MCSLSYSLGMHYSCVLLFVLVLQLYKHFSSSVSLTSSVKMLLIYGIVSQAVSLNFHSLIIQQSLNAIYCICLSFHLQSTAVNACHQSTFNFRYAYVLRLFVMFLLYEATAQCNLSLSGCFCLNLQCYMYLLFGTYWAIIHSDKNFNQSRIVSKPDFLLTWLFTCFLLCMFVEECNCNTFHDG